MDINNGLTLIWNCKTISGTVFTLPISFNSINYSIITCLYDAGRNGSEGATIGQRDIKTKTISDVTYLSNSNSPRQYIAIGY